MDYTIKNVGSGSGQINWSNSGKTFIGWTIGQSITTTESDWYDANQSYGGNANLTLYAQWYDINSLEGAYKSYVQTGDYVLSPKYTDSGTNTFVNDSNLANSYSMSPTCQNGFSERITVGSWYTGGSRYRPYRVAKSLGLRILVNDTTTDSYTPNPELQSICSYDRVNEPFNDSLDVDARISRLLGIQDTLLTYSDIVTRTNSLDNISLPSGTRSISGATVTKNANYDIISASAGYVLSNATNNGSGVSRVYVYQSALDANGNVVSMLAKSYSSATPKVKHTNYIIEVNNTKTATSTFVINPYTSLGKQRYIALTNLEGSKSNYFTADQLKQTKVEYPTHNSEKSDWGYQACETNFHVDSGRILGVSNHGVANEVEAGNMSFGVYNKAYVTGVNTTNGTVYTRFYAGNKYYNKTTGVTMTKTYGYAYVVYVSSGVIQLEGGQCEET